MTNAIVEKIDALWAELKTALTPIGQPIVDDVEAAISAGYAWFKTNVPAIAVSLAEALLAGAAAGTPWADLEAQLITQVAAAGKTIEKQVATAALNAAQTNLIAKGVPAIGVSAAPAAQ